MTQGFLTCFLINLKRVQNTNKEVKTSAVGDPTLYWRVGKFKNYLSQ